MEHGPMSSPSQIKVFFEPIMEQHSPGLYDAASTATSIPFEQAVSDAGRAAYNDDGFLVVRGVFAGEEIARGRDELEAMTLADDPRCDMVCYEGEMRRLVPASTAEENIVSGKGVGDALALGRQERQLPDLPAKVRAPFIRKFMGFLQTHSDLHAIAYHPKLLTLVRSMLGAQPELFQEMALIKPPGGREKPWHQDHAYFNYKIENRIVGIWIPFENTTPDNGCMFAIRGGHQAGPRPHVKRRDWQICDTDVETIGRVCIPMHAGEVMIFDGKLPHGTPVNKTDKFRWAIQFHYKAQTAVEVPDDVRLASFGSEGKNVTC
jgi:phytanoyl-CoA hydroxylase